MKVAHCVPAIVASPIIAWRQISIHILHPGSGRISVHLVQKAPLGARMRRPARDWNAIIYEPHAGSET